MCANVTNDTEYSKTTYKKGIIVFIIHANSGWEKIAGGSHVTIYFADPGFASDGESNNPTLYDPVEVMMVELKVPLEHLMVFFLKKELLIPKLL